MFLSCRRPNGRFFIFGLAANSAKFPIQKFDSCPFANSRHLGPASRISISLYNELSPNLRRRDGRVAEGARLESVFRGNSNVGSNPTLSAIQLAAQRIFSLIEANCRWGHFSLSQGESAVHFLRAEKRLRIEPQANSEHSLSEIGQGELLERTHDCLSAESIATFAAKLRQLELQPLLFAPLFTRSSLFALDKGNAGVLSLFTALVRMRGFTSASTGQPFMLFHEEFCHSGLTLK